MKGEHPAAGGLRVQVIREAASLPVDSYANGSAPSTADSSSSGSPSTYFALCHSTPVSVSPTFFASTTPTGLWSTKSR